MKEQSIMTHMTAFIDESGGFGWDFSKKGTSTHFVLVAIIVQDNVLSGLQESIEAIRKEEFQQSEMKSSKIGNDLMRRLRIMQKLCEHPFSFYAVVFDKQKLSHMEGLRYKKSFYKFFNNIIHKELQKNFSQLTIVADETGSDEYMASFIKYVRERQKPINLFGDTEFSFQKSDNNILIQLADIFAGTIAKIYTTKKHDRVLKVLFRMISSKGCVEVYPKEFQNFDIDSSAITQEYDKEIATICYRRASEFVASNDSRKDEDVYAQVLTVKYLLFRFMNNDLRQYISTLELRCNIERLSGGPVTEHFFRTRVIAKLRDKGVIISSTSRGYKIPSHLTDLYDFVNITSKTAIPMLDRMKKCFEIIKMGTQGKVDLLADDKYEILRHCVDALRTNNLSEIE